LFFYWQRCFSIYLIGFKNILNKKSTIKRQIMK
jgi:hypothetical protein